MRPKLPAEGLLVLVLHKPLLLGLDALALEIIIIINNINTIMTSADVRQERSWVRRGGLT
jgi:hypothetical protein